MGLIYSINNYIDDDTLIFSSSEDDVYVTENVHNIRPSKPFRFLGHGDCSSDGSEWLCFDFGANVAITLVAIFNQNLTNLSGGCDHLLLRACADACPGQSGYPECTWDTPTFETEMKQRITANPILCPEGDETYFKNLFLKFDVQTHQYWMLDFIDATNPHAIELGEVFFGRWCEFSSSVHLQPGRPDGPEFYMEKIKTHYGQDWSTYYSEAERFTLTFKNINDPAVRDELHVFLSAVQQQDGRFVIIPDDTKPFCYYVSIENMGDYATRLIYGIKELREWKIDLLSLVEGVNIL